MIQNQDQRMVWCILHKATALPAYFPLIQLKIIFVGVFEFTKPVFLVIAASSALEPAWHWISHSMSFFWTHCFLFPVIRNTVWGVGFPPGARWFVRLFQRRRLCVPRVGGAAAPWAGQGSSRASRASGEGPGCCWDPRRGRTRAAGLRRRAQRATAELPAPSDSVVVEQSSSSATQLLPQWWRQRVNAVIPVTESRMLLCSVWFFSSLFFCVFYIIQLCLLDLF